MDNRLGLVFFLILNGLVGLLVDDSVFGGLEQADSFNFDLSEIETGTHYSYITEGFLVAIYRRTPDEIDALMATSGDFTDSAPENQIITPALKHHRPVIHFKSDWVNSSLRSKREEFFVYINFAPKSGCVLKSHTNTDVKTLSDVPEGFSKGFIDPCDGVFYDLAGRVFDHPKAKNDLYVPNYRFINDSTIELIPEPTITEKSQCDFIAVVDGDTLKVNCEGTEHWVHLHGIVAPQLVSSEHGICRNHPMAEKSKKALEMFLPAKRYPGLVVEPTGEFVDGEIDAVVRVMPEYEQRIEQLFEMGPVYAMEGVDQGLSFDQYVFGHADLVEGHPQADRFQKIKNTFHTVADANKSGIQQELGMPLQRKHKTLPAVCSTSPIQWAEMPVAERCEIQSFCNASQETWVSKAYKMIEFFFRLIF